jgi:hypothetical protein
MYVKKREMKKKAGKKEKKRENENIESEVVINY